MFLLQFGPCDAVSEEHGHEHSGRAVGGVHGDEGSAVPVRRDTAAEDGAGRVAAVEGREGFSRALLSSGLSGMMCVSSASCSLCDQPLYSVMFMFSSGSETQSQELEK